MKSGTTPEFWECFNALPTDVQRGAARAFAIWRIDHRHPALHFKRLKESIWSVRVGLRWRAIGRFDGDTMTWFWIGSHADYDRLVG